jgi:hypothetical protein
MHTDDFEHLTHREWREILRWRAWDAKIALDQAVETRRKTVGNYLVGKARESGRVDGYAASPRHRIHGAAKIP